jgi:Ca2+-binding RTX toxin-like protein
LLISDQAEIYTVQLDQYKMERFEFTIDQLPTSAPIYLELKGSVLPKSFSNARSVASIEKFHLSETNAYYVQADSVLLKLVPERAGHLPVAFPQELEDSVYWSKISFDYSENADFGIANSGLGSAENRATNSIYPNTNVESNWTLDFETSFDSDKPLVFSEYTNTELRDHEYSKSNLVSDLSSYGRWSDPATWGGRMPGVDDIVVVSNGSKILLDTSVDVGGILVHGNLSSIAILDEDGKSIQLSTDWILINEGGLFQAGSPKDLLDTEFEVVLTGDKDLGSLNISNFLQTSASNVFHAIGGSTYSSPEKMAITVHGYDNDELMVGRLGNDILMGNAGSDRIEGLEGDDIMYGGEGNDTLFGGDGNDRLVGDSGDDLIYGGFGDDIIKGRAGNNVMHGEMGNDVLWGADDGLDELHGGQGSDVLLGLGGDDYLAGGDGDDFIYGGRGEDTASGGDGSDILRGNRGDDILSGGAGVDRIYGGGQNDYLFGEGDRDFLLGENGNDVLDGGSGNDNLTGGQGEDVFIFYGEGYGYDRILDFESGIDKISFGEDSGFVSFSDIRNLASDVHAGLKINFGGGDVLFIEGYSLTTMVEDDFLF